MPIVNDTPVSTTFDKYWVQNLTIGGSPSGKTTLHAILKPYDGSNTLDAGKILTINDVFDLASKDPQFLKVMNDVLLEIERQAKLNNVI